MSDSCWVGHVSTTGPDGLSNNQLAWQTDGRRRTSLADLQANQALATKIASTTYSVQQLVLRNAVHAINLSRFVLASNGAETSLIRDQPEGVPLAKMIKVGAGKPAQKNPSFCAGLVGFVGEGNGIAR